MRPLASAAFAAFVLFATAHESTGMDMDMDMSMDMAHGAPTPTASPGTSDGPMSYFAYGKHSSSVIAHIALMVVAWCFILPVGESRNVD